LTAAPPNLTGGFEFICLEFLLYLSAHGIESIDAVSDCIEGFFEGEVFSRTSAVGIRMALATKTGVIEFTAGIDASRTMGNTPLNFVTIGPAPSI